MPGSGTRKSGRAASPGRPAAPVGRANTPASPDACPDLRSARTTEQRHPHTRVSGHSRIEPFLNQGAAAGAPAIGSALRTPARHRADRPSAWYPQIKDIPLPDRTITARAVFLAPVSSSSRPPSQVRPCGPSHAVGGACQRRLRERRQEKVVPAQRIATLGCQPELLSASLTSERSQAIGL